MRWLQSNDQERGYVATAQTMYELSRDWYASRMDLDWHPPSAEEAAAIFSRHGLTGNFWDLS